MSKCKIIFRFPKDYFQTVETGVKRIIFRMSGSVDGIRCVGAVTVNYN